MTTVGILAFAGLPEWAERLVWAGVTVLVALALNRLLRQLIRRWAVESVEATADLVRLRRQETAAAFLLAGVRYTIAAAAVFALIGIFADSPRTALGGASLVVILVAFAIQRVLADIVAGTFALIEDQYAVGDFIAVEPSGLAGVVEEFGLRTTVLRGLNGDRYIVPNSQITAVRRSERGYRRYNVELLTRAPDRVEEAVRTIGAYAPGGEARFLRPPEVVERHELEDGLWRLRVQATVAPTLEWLVESFVVESLAKLVGDALVSEPIAYTLDTAALRRYQRRVVIR